MHRSKLCEVIIDCSEETLDAAVAFWSGALGMPARRPTDPADPYVNLEGTIGGLKIGLQRVRDRSRVHLDIEADDVEAEVRRLEALGATREAQVHTWWVMRDPAGLLFCVIPPQSDDFLARAHTWGAEEQDPAGK